MECCSETYISMHLNCIPNSYNQRFSQNYAQSIYLVITQILGYYRKRNEFLVSISMVWQTHYLQNVYIHQIQEKQGTQNFI